MYAYTPQMNNESTTTVAPKETYHSDAIYVMYAVFIALGFCFCIILLVWAYTYCKKICHEHGFSPKLCCFKKKNSTITPVYLVETQPVPDDFNSMEYFYDDYDIDHEYKYDNSIAI